MSMDFDRNVEADGVDYSRSEEMLQTAQLASAFMYGDSPRLIIVGCGGIGFWAGIYASMLGFFEAMYLFDADKIDSTNIARVPVPAGWVGVNKAIALRKLVHQLRPSLQVLPIMKPASKVLLDALSVHKRDGKNVYILDCTDDARAQNEIFNWRKQMPQSIYAKAGYEGLSFGIYTEINTWVPADYRPGYTTAASNVLTSAAAAAFAVTSLIFKGNTSEAKFNMLERVCTTARQTAITKAMTAIRNGQPVTTTLNGGR